MGLPISSASVLQIATVAKSCEFREEFVKKVATPCNAGSRPSAKPASTIAING